MHRLLLALPTIALALAPAASLSISDDFEALNPGLNWSTSTRYNDAGSAFHGTTYLMTTGNPNQWARTQHNLSANAQYEAAYLYTASTWDTVSQGALQSVSFNFDTIRETTPGSLYIRPIVEVGGIIFAGGNVGLGTTWANQSTGNLGSLSFNQLFSTNHPDFVSGGVIRVGYVIGSNNWGGTTSTPVAGVDNFSATLTGAVPEPSTWALVISGFGLAASGRFRRKQ